MECEPSKKKPHGHLNLSKQAIEIGTTNSAFKKIDHYLHLKMPLQPGKKLLWIHN